MSTTLSSLLPQPPKHGSAPAGLWGQALRERLSELREFLVPLWEDFGSETCVQDAHKGHGMCHVTSAFLMHALGPGWLWQGGISNGRHDFTESAGRGTLGGSMRGVSKMGGFCDQAGVWNDHFWVRNGAVIVDLTASQFGDDDIIITDAQDPRYCHNLSAREYRESMLWHQARAAQWAQLHKQCEMVRDMGHEMAFGDLMSEQNVTASQPERTRMR